MSTDEEQQDSQSPDRSSPEGWFGDLRRRKVFRVMAAYGVGAWLMLQLVAILAEAFPLPNWTMAAATVVLALGFPIAAALSWVFQVTPDGIVVDMDKARPLTANRSRLIHFIDVIIICILLAAVLYLSYGDIFDRNAQEEIRIAILPFENLSGDDSVGYLGDGIADDIRARLHDVPQILLAARSSSAAVFGKGLDAREIGERLTVQHVLEGTVRKTGDRIRVTAQLVNTSNGIATWVKTYNARFRDVFEMQTNISLMVASQLEILLSPDIREALAHNPTENPVAFDFYIQGQSYLRRPQSFTNAENAASLYRRAIAEDPSFALGYAGLCDVAIVKYTLSSDTQYVDAAEVQCARALELDSDLAEVHSVLGRLYLQLGQFDQAEEEFSEALDIDPRSTTALSGMGRVFSENGSLIEAEERYKTTIELSPGDWAAYNQLAFFYRSQGRYEEAIDNYERMIELSPDNAHGYNDLGTVYYMLGEFDDAALYWRQSLDISPGRAAFSNTGAMYYLAGRYTEAATMFNKALVETDTDFRLWGNLADAQRFIDGGKNDAEMNYLRAIELAHKQLSVNPTDPETMTYLAWFYVNVDKEQEARNFLKQAQEQPNRDIQQKFFDALIYSLLGDSVNAKSTISELQNEGFSDSILEATPEFEFFYLSPR